MTNILPQLFALMNQGRIEIFMISAGYGIVHGSENAQNYDASLKGSNATYWLDNHIVEIISNIITKGGPDEVYGYFAGRNIRTSLNTQYRYIFCEAVTLARTNGFEGLAGCLGIKDGTGCSSTLSMLGGTFVDHFNHGFDYSWAKNPGNWPKPGQGLAGHRGQIGFDIL